MIEDNKEYIINIRVSKEVYNKLKNKAKENSESLSSLVRKTLDDSWEILGDIRNEFFGDAKNSNGVLYYQKIIVAKDTNCSRCQADISKGSEAYLGETKTGSKKYFCNKCFIDN